jgi:hypothetical protein
MLDPVILALLVEVLKRLAEIFLPTLPITVELINAIILLLFGVSGLLAVRAGVRKFAPRVFGYKELFLKK